jgi:hypothetical protein
MAIERISLAAVIDVTIAVTLVWSLHCSKTGFKRYDLFKVICSIFVLTVLAFKNGHDDQHACESWQCYMPRFLSH